MKILLSIIVLIVIIVVFISYVLSILKLIWLFRKILLIALIILSGVWINEHLKEQKKIDDIANPVKGDIYEIELVEVAPFSKYGYEPKETITYTLYKVDSITSDSVYLQLNHHEAFSYSYLEESIKRDSNQGFGNGEMKWSCTKADLVKMYEEGRIIGKH